MPRSRTRRHRGGGIVNWIKSAHQKMRSVNGYSRGLSAAWEKYGKIRLKSSSPYPGLINKAVALGINKIRQAGYGRSGHGLKRTGMGLRRTGMGRRLKY
jgi:hypothetical protein